MAPLEYFADTYVHQDWDLDAAGPLELVQKSRDDEPPEDVDELAREFREALESDDAVLGLVWTGCWLLHRFHEGFRGLPSNFTDRTGCEAAANGRGIPDDDVPVGDAQAATLATRGVEFARRALAVLPDEAPPVTAFVSVGRTAYDESVFTGSVTFCADHEGEPPYLEDVELFEECIAVLRSTREDRAGSRWPAPVTSGSINPEANSRCDAHRTSRTTTGSSSKVAAVSLDGLRRSQRGQPLCSDLSTGWSSSSRTGKGDRIREAISHRRSAA